jgi:hypothetical protein
MQLRNWVACVAGATLMLLSAAAMAQDVAPEPEPPQAAVTFSVINDGVPSRFFDAVTTAPDPSNLNRLIIGFNSGLDAKTWKGTDFRASTAAFSHRSAMDTISFRIQAPEGYYISSITYSQRGTGSVLRLAGASGSAHWVVGDIAAPLGDFSTTPTLTRTIDLTGSDLTFLPVSITTGLFVWAAPSLGSATLSVTEAEVVVEIQPRSY